jgi:glycosyltransferase involved in cell wall biosynthesis
MPEPLLTALMPVHAYHPFYLREAVQSMQRQTNDSWRLLIIVEPDGDRELRERLAPELDDERIQMVQNRGRKLAGAFNTGMRAARTEFVAILLGDDLWAREAVDVLTREITANPTVDFFHSARRVVGDAGEPLSSVHPSRPDVRAGDFGRGSPVKHLLCWRRRLALSVGGMDETLDSVGVDDFDFPWTMAEQGAVFDALPDCLYIYRDHRSSYRLTTHLPLSVHLRAMWRIQRKHGRGALQSALAANAARRSYMRQCLFHFGSERRLRDKLGLPSPRPWRETYR